MKRSTLVLSLDQSRIVAAMEEDSNRLGLQLLNSDLETWSWRIGSKSGNIGYTHVRTCYTLQQPLKRHNGNFLSDRDLVTIVSNYQSQLGPVRRSGPSWDWASACKPTINSYGRGGNDPQTGSFKPFPITMTEQWLRSFKPMWHTEQPSSTKNHETGCLVSQDICWWTFLYDLKPLLLPMPVDI